MSDGGEAPEEQEAAVEEEKNEETVVEISILDAAVTEEEGEAVAEGDGENPLPEGEAPADGEAVAEGES